MKNIFLLCIFINFTDVELLPLQGKLEGGNEIVLKEHDFFKKMASIFYYNQLVCAAVLVSDIHLLTAAHCIANLIYFRNSQLFDEFFALIAADNDREATRPYFFHKVEVHPSYNLTEFKPDYNIGIITLTEKHQIGTEIEHPAWDMGNMMYKQGQVGYIPGYKIEYPNEDKPFLPYLYLRYTKVTIAIIHHKIAKSIKERWGNRTSFFVGIFKDHSCLSSQDCGTVMFTGKPYKIRGILSYVSEEPEEPGLFIAIDSFVPWIQAAMNDEQYEKCMRLEFTRDLMYSQSPTHFMTHDTVFQL